jgi:hypothetical protein
VNPDAHSIHCEELNETQFVIIQTPFESEYPEAHVKHAVVLYNWQLLGIQHPFETT